MDWNAVSLEAGMLVLAVVVLAWDLTAGHGPNASRKGHYVIGFAGLLGGASRSHVIQDGSIAGPF